MDELTISRENFDRLLTYTQQHYIYEMLRRYIGFSEHEADDLMPEILQFCWNAAQADISVFERLTKLLDKAIAHCGIDYLRRQRQ